MLSSYKVFCLILLCLFIGGGVTYSAIDSPFGIFEVYGYPKYSTTDTQKYFNALGVADENAFYTKLDTYINDIGLHWTRNVFRVSESNYSPNVYEDKVYRLNKEGVNIVGTFEMDAPPTNEADYIKRIKDTVEMFDNDGNGDSIKPTCVKYWQIENEVNFTTYWSGTAQQYTRLLYIAYNAIKSADPDAKVLIAGEASQASDNGTFYSSIIKELTTNNTYRNFRYFDIADIHIYGAYNEYNDVETYSKRFRNLIRGTLYDGVPVWITECGTFTGDPHQYPYVFQTEEDQARSLVKRYIVGFKNDIEKIFWSPGLVETYLLDTTSTVDYFDMVGLMYNGIPDSDPANDKGKWVKKLSYYTFKTLIEEMGRNVRYLGELSLGVTNVYGYKFDCDSKKYYIVWNEGSSNKSVSFTVNSSSVVVTDLIPNASYYINKYEVSRGTGNKITITVGQNPLLIEESMAPEPAKSPDNVPNFPYSYVVKLISQSGKYEVTDASTPPTITNTSPTTSQISTAIIGGYNNSALRFTTQQSSTYVILDMGAGTELRDGKGDDLTILRCGGSVSLLIEASNSSSFSSGVKTVGTLTGSNTRGGVNFNIGKDDNQKYRYIRIKVNNSVSGYVDIERVQLINFGDPQPIYTAVPAEEAQYYQ